MCFRPTRSANDCLLLKACKAAGCYGSLLYLAQGLTAADDKLSELQKALDSQLSDASAATAAQLAAADEKLALAAAASQLAADNLSARLDQV